MKTETRTVHSLDVPIGPGRQTLRVSVSRREDGEPESLVLATGFGGGESFLRPGWESLPLRLPASIVPELRRVLDALMEGGG